MNNTSKKTNLKVLFIAAFFSAGVISAVQQFAAQPTNQVGQDLVSIVCIDGPIDVQELTLRKFDFFAGMAEGYGCKLSELELERTPDTGYVLVCFVQKSDNVFKFHMNSTKVVMQLFVEFI